MVDYIFTYSFSFLSNILIWTIGLLQNPIIDGFLHPYCLETREKEIERKRLHRYENKKSEKEQGLVVAVI